MIRTAIMIDGAFYRKRAFYFWGDRSPSDRAKELEDYCKKHIKDEKAGAELYRIFITIVLRLQKEYIILSLKNKLIFQRPNNSHGQTNSLGN